MPIHEPLSIEQIRSLIRDVPDFPQPGILFRDITPMLANGEALHTAASLLASPFEAIDLVVAIESRGFILGAPVALELGAGLVPVRKPGKLPYRTISQAYSLEYGTNTLEMHVDAIQPGQRVLIVDDLLATGGTVGATIKLIEELGGVVAGISVLAELSALHGREVVRPHDVHSLLVF